jgi:hypothetical protein
MAKPKAERPFNVTAHLALWTILAVSFIVAVALMVDPGVHWPGWVIVGAVFLTAWLAVVLVKMFQPGRSS